MFDINDITSEYSHRNIIYTEGTRPHMMLDCTGFVAVWLRENGFIRALAEIHGYIKRQNFIKTNRFYCQDFDGFLAQNPQYWKQVSDPKPGDIIIVIFPNQNGHCMVITTANGNGKYRVMDSTQSPHENDTRANNQTGIGFGNIEIHNDIYYAKNSERAPRHAKIFFVRPIKN